VKLTMSRWRAVVGDDKLVDLQHCDVPCERFLEFLAEQGGL
jgi:hypothetical protein